MERRASEGILGNSRERPFPRSAAVRLLAGLVAHTFAPVGSRPLRHQAVVQMTEVWVHALGPEIRSLRAIARAADPEIDSSGQISGTGAALRRITPMRRCASLGATRFRCHDRFASRRPHVDVAGDGPARQPACDRLGRLVFVRNACLHDGWRGSLRYSIRLLIVNRAAPDACVRGR